MSALTRAERLTLLLAGAPHGARRGGQLPAVGRGSPLRDRHARARGPGVGRVVRHRAARRALRPGRHGDAAVDARQPAGAVRGHLRAAEGRARGRADGDHRFDPRQRAARARPRDRGRRAPRPGRGDALLNAPAAGHGDAAAGDRVHHRPARALARGARSRRAITSSRSPSSARSACCSSTRPGWCPTCAPTPRRTPASRPAGDRAEEGAGPSAADARPAGPRLSLAVHARAARSSPGRRRRSSRTGSSTRSRRRSSS